MDPCACTKSQIPCYQGIEMGKKDYRDDPSYEVNSLNERIVKVNGQNNLFSLAAVVTGAAVIAFGSLAVVMTLSSLYLSIPLALSMNLLGVSIVAFERGQYIEYQSNLKKTINAVENFFQKYGTEFIFLDRCFTNLDFQFSAEDVAVIKLYGKYFPAYRVRYNTHYKVSGGETDKRPLQELKIEQICQKDNQELVKETYEPWLKLILKLDQKNLPAEIMAVIGKMAGLGLSNGMYSFGDAILSCEGREKIKVYFGVKSSENREIKTVEEFTDFVEKTLNITLD